MSSSSSLLLRGVPQPTFHPSKHLLSQESKIPKREKQSGLFFNTRLFLKITHYNLSKLTHFQNEPFFPGKFNGNEFQDGDEEFFSFHLM